MKRVNWVLLMLCLCGLPAAGEMVGKVESKELIEISGLAVSRTEPNVLWVHNDSGDRARFYAINPGGQSLGTFTLAETDAFDWEDIAAGPGPMDGRTYLYVGDIGDNVKIRPNIVVYRIPEPLMESNEEIAEFEALWCLYPDGPRDAEALMVDPTTKDILIVSKEKANCNVYMVKYPQRPDRFHIMDKLTSVPVGRVTAGDISADGRRLLLRNYEQAFLWTRQTGEDWRCTLARKPMVVPLVRDSGGEAIAFVPDGTAFYTISEGKHPLIRRYDLSAAPDPASGEGPQENSSRPR